MSNSNPCSKWEIKCDLLKNAQKFQAMHGFFEKRHTILKFCTLNSKILYTVFFKALPIEIK